MTSLVHGSQPKTSCKTDVACANIKKAAAFQYKRPCCKPDDAPVINHPSQTEWVSFPLEFISDVAPDPVKATNTVYDDAKYTIIGNTMFVQYYYYHNDNTGASAGGANGSYSLKLPNIPILADYANETNQHVGIAYVGSNDGINPTETKPGLVIFDPSEDALKLLYFNGTTLELVVPGGNGDLSRPGVEFSVSATLQLVPI